MSCSTLNLATGGIPSEAAFDLREGLTPQATHISLAKPDAQREHFSSGDVWIDYPFAVPLAKLAGAAIEPCESASAREEMEQQEAVRYQISEHVKGIVAEASERGISDHDVEWALTELILNATQYGSLLPIESQSEQQSKGPPVVGLVRVEWDFNKDLSDPCLRISVSNPVKNLFDPSYYPRMSPDEYLEQILSAECNTHAGLLTLMGKVKLHTGLSYLWELQDGGRIRCSMFRLSDTEAGELKDLQQMPVRLSVGRYDEDNQPLTYNEDQFMSDVADHALKVDSVTISCVFGKQRRAFED